MYLKLFLLALGIVGIAMLGFAVKIFFTKDKTLAASSCKAADGLSDKGVSCGCSSSTEGGACAS